MIVGRFCYVGVARANINSDKVNRRELHVGVGICSIGVYYNTLLTTLRGFVYTAKIQSSNWHDLYL